ncbi:hypothetical protein [Amphibacillus sediminis]|uniref:hypothetical protein n=1 Tax=Amphibacillus sediminis TaxID=360185 RepID=UPI0008331DBC|nr:hypothetical protein [Amphibacillus sediminis]
MKKRIIIILLVGTILALIFLCYDNHNVSDPEKVKEEMKEAGIEFAMSGYYYFGFLDQREKQDSEFEIDYFYHMDNHFQDYYYSMFITTKEDKELAEDYITYFESIGGLRLYSIPSTGLSLKNGDYITFIVKSPIKEVYPARVEQIENVEVLHARVLK